MKRILLSLSVFMFFQGVRAQSSLTLPAIDRYVWGSVEDGILQCEGTVENTNGSTAIDVRVKRITVDTVPGTQNYFCWEQCYEPATSVSPTALNIPVGERISQFYADYKSNGIPGVSVLTYCFYDDANEADSVCATVRFSATPVGILDVFTQDRSGVSEPYPNPARNEARVNYALHSGWQSAKVDLYSMLGAKVRTVRLTNDHGTLTLHVSDLPSGMYFYSLVVDDKTVTTRKMLVTR